MKNDQNNPLAVLKVIDRLEIGPVKIEKRKVSAPYTVIQGSQSDSMDFTYSFDEDIFTFADESEQNLAAVMTAQVALNYGLFCRQIVFKGMFDKYDQAFINEMVENTSREIYVKKILEPNPFLKEEFANIPAVKQKKYTQAEIIFEQTTEPAKVDPWSGDRRKIAILSSGGKDSLLSHGLISESGFDTHPIFINESGRHWYTALNAYRYFSKNVKNTARTWTNSDRVFSWMLRHMSFIRQDFNRVRSDEYPIRLWTVAVFLFGAVPVLRKRGIGRIVIGDEYDTTVRLSHKGITHYDGLFDQSRYFDNAMTRYFNRKNWNVSQFSVLRPLSEMMIEKILVKRYPDLQKLQVSCHAAHMDGETVKPCGKCEKCRRIIGMLTALDADPKNCGYSENQITAGLEELRTKKIHQEAAGSNQMSVMLKEKAILPADFKAKAHPEILQVRISNENSPLDGIPVDLRKPIFGIFKNYANGAVKKTGKMWVEFDVFSDPQFSSPYRFEKPQLLQNKQESAMPIKNNHILGNLTWPDAKKRLQEMDVALLPVGAIEQHGPHLPLDTDAFDAEYLCKKIAENCTDPKPLVLPLISYGVSYHHDDFPGTISISNETLSKLVYDIGMSAARNGITKLVIINGHGGNAPTLQFAAQMINRDAHIFTTVDSGETSDIDLDRLSETEGDVHAGEIETSTTLANRPELVKMDKARRFVPKFSSRYLDFSAKRSVEWYARTLKISTSGVLGDPTKASAEKGHKMWEVMIRNLVELIEFLKKMSLEEIYEKKY